MSNQNRHHWQDDSQDYTTNQYVVYVGFAVFLLLTLVALFIYLNRSTNLPKTYVVSITSRAGGGQPIFPFQNEDRAAFKNRFDNGIFHHLELDDKSSFNVVEKKIAEIMGNAERGESVLIVLSAAGITGDKILVQSSESRDPIDLQAFLTKLSENNPNDINTILLFDCQYLFANHDAYVSTTGGGDDFNPFSENLSNLVTDDDAVSILVYGQPGERPYYSITQRRTLLSYALEKTLETKRGEDSWTVEVLNNRLNEQCLRFGGDGAPSISIVQGKENPRRFHSPDMGEPTTTETSDEMAETEGDFLITATATAALENADSRWQAYHESIKQMQQRYGMHPSAVDARAWETITGTLIEDNRLQIQSDGPSQRSINMDMEDFARDIDLESYGKRFFLIGNQDDASLSQMDRETRDVMRDYVEVCRVQSLSLHYLALCDSLAWLFPNETNVQRIVRETDELIQKLDKLESVFSVTDTGEQIALEKALDVSEYRNGVLRQESILHRSIGEFVQNTLAPERSGFQHEMAIATLLRLPTIQGADDEQENPQPLDARRLPTRQHLMSLLEATQQISSTRRITKNDRELASQQRLKLYQRYQESGLRKPTKENELIRDVYAYLLTVVPHRLTSVKILPRPKDEVAAIGNRSSLQEGLTIEEDGSPIDLGIEGQNAKVQVHLSFSHAAQSNFEYSDETTAIMDRDQEIRIRATRKAAPSDLPYFLNVTLVDDHGKTRDALKIPLALPWEKRVDLQIIDLELAPSAPRNYQNDKIGKPLRPYPCDKFLPFSFTVANHWHLEQKGKAELYACTDQSSARVSGQILPEDLERESIDPGHVLIATWDYELAARESEELQYVPCVWKSEVKDAEWQVPQGLLCVLTPAGEGAATRFWIPVFPREQPAVDARCFVDSNSRMQLTVDRLRSFSDLRSITIAWHVRRRGMWEASKNGEFVLAKNRRSMTMQLFDTDEMPLSSGDVLFLDIDGWPRKLAFELGNGRQWNMRDRREALVNVALGSEEIPPPKKSKHDLPSNNRFARRFGTPWDTQLVTATVQLNIPFSGELFSFDDSNDYVLLRKDRRSERIFYPRTIKTSLNISKSGAVSIKTGIEDIKKTFSNFGTAFEIGPHLVIDGAEAIELDGPNRVQFVFDVDKPIINNIVVDGTLVKPGRPLLITVKATDEQENGSRGVGIDSVTGYQFFVSEPSGQPSFEGKPVPFKKKDTNTFEMLKRPEEPGEYTVGVRVVDRVGNDREDVALRSFKIPFPLGTNDSGADENQPATKKTYDLTLNVRASAFDSPFKNLRLTIVPEVPKQKISAKQFLFKGLTEGTLYTINGTCIVSGVEFNAELTHKYSEGGNTLRLTME